MSVPEGVVVSTVTLMSSDLVAESSTVTFAELCCAQHNSAKFAMAIVGVVHDKVHGTVGWSTALFKLNSRGAVSSAAPHASGVARSRLAPRSAGGQRRARKGANGA
jgi:hypothetical protein